MRKSVRCVINSLVTPWTNLNTAVQAAQVLNSGSPISPFGQNVKLVNAKANPVGTIMQITSNPKASAIPIETAPVDGFINYSQAGGNKTNTESLTDKWIRMDDGAGAAINGGLVDVFIDQA